MNEHKIPVVLIIGALGAGKTTLIRHWLKNKPQFERWAVLVNEFGEIGIDGASLRGRDGSVVQEIAGGCICCTSGPQMGIVLNRIIRQKPNLILIEPTGLASPARMYDMLKRPEYEHLLELKLVISVVDIETFLRGDWEQDEASSDRIAMADVLIGSKADAVDRGQAELFMEKACRLFPPKEQVYISEHGQLSLQSVLVGGRSERRDPNIEERFARARAPHLFSESGSTDPSARRVYNGKVSTGVSRAISKQGNIHGFGIVLPPEHRFSPVALKTFFVEWPSWLEEQGAKAMRGKGLFRCGSSWWLFNWVDRQVSSEIIAWRKDSRLELIAQSEIDLAWEGLEIRLLECKA